MIRLSLRALKLALASSLVCFGASAALAQTKLDRQLSYIDIALQGTGEFTHTITGPVTIPATDFGTSVTQTGSNTFGGLFTIRYTPKPYLGAELNAGYARYTEGYSVPPYQIQTQADEFTFGYVVTPPYRILGVKPYASAGVGTVRFAPTRGGGQGAPAEGRLGYYYNIGVEQALLGDNFGVRLGFRQLFYTAPDYYQNYLTINKHTFTSEPMIGFFLRF